MLTNYMKVSDSSLFTSSIMSATLGTILLTGLVPEAIKASHSPKLDSTIQIEKIANEMGDK